MRATLQAEGPRAPDDVWDRYQRPARWTEWSPQIRSVEYPGELLSPGTSGTVHGPARLPVHFRVLTLDPAPPVRAWSWTAEALGVRLKLQHTVEPSGTGTRTGLVIEGPGPVVLLYQPVARWALRRLVH